MRPLRLELKGFTAFRDTAEIDFTKLDVFAIAGQTGSGKSSLLDAMTYALYGRVERVGDRVSQLISQGQPRMAVTLEFEVGHDRYRVTRSTPAKTGPTKILLERQAEGEWRQAGDGADRVKEVERMIAGAIGLTYDGFTRSVLLPQGKFAEFLVGDPKKRRDILTELLGLSLFRRMAERAGAIAKESAVRAQERGLSLEREYAEATPEALNAAKAEAKEAQQRERALSKAATEVLDILARWQEAERSIGELRACAEEGGLAAETVETATEELATLAEVLEAASAEALQRDAHVKSLEKALEEAKAALTDAEKTFGPVGELTRAQARAHTFADALGARAAKVEQAAAITKAAEALRQVQEEMEMALAERSEGLAARRAEATEAEVALEDARHADLVTAVSAGLGAGDPCPVCGLPLEKAPKRGPAGGLARAEKALAKARAAVDAAQLAALDAERSLHAAGRDMEANAAEQKRLAAEATELDVRIGADVQALAELLGSPLPADPGGSIQERLDALQGLDRAEREAAREATEASKELVKAEQERDRAASRVDRLRDRLAADHRPLFDRAARALGKAGGSVRLPAPPSTDDAKALLGHARKLGEALRAFAGGLEAELEQRSSIGHRLVEEANEKTAGLVEPGPTLEEIAARVNAECRTATAAVATAEQRATDLVERLERKKQLAVEVKDLDERSRLFRALALELRADRLIAFLQAEALQLLATAGSDRLASLSDGRYRIACRDDEFFVLDTWNGDEERSVKTLSGGETFLASLALALALADQVRSLSVTDRARLDSLFLDEGFGTLDQESLKVVVDAIEQLAGDGRLVGVITHVRDLAEQFPRIEVEKSQRGSRLALVT